MNVLSKIMRSVRSSDVPAVKAFYKHYLKVRKLAHEWADLPLVPVYDCFKILPKRDKLVASSYQGKNTEIICNIS